MPSFQNSAPGAKSMKFQDALNPFTPFLAQPGDEPPEEDSTPLTERFDTRLRLDPSSSSRPPPQQQQQQQYSQPEQTAAPESGQANPQTTEAGVSSVFDKIELQKKKKKKKSDKPTDDDDDDDDVSDDDDDSDSDGEFDYLLDDVDDEESAILQAIRQKRLKELQKASAKEAEHKSKGHGEVRTITQDEFLKECTASKYVVVHFFHKEFEKCKVMDHHLKVLAENPKHLSCKFVRIDAEKAPFFVVKLKIKTLPTVIVFKDGQTIERLLGFEGLVSSAYRDAQDFPTSRLGYWLESTGAMEYDGPDSDEEEDRTTGTKNHRTQVYDEDV